MLKKCILKYIFNTAFILLFKLLTDDIKLLSNMLPVDVKSLDNVEILHLVGISSEKKLFGIVDILLFLCVVDEL